MVFGFLDRLQAMGGQASTLLVLCCGPEAYHIVNALYTDMNNEQTNSGDLNNLFKRLKCCMGKKSPPLFAYRR